MRGASYDPQGEPVGAPHSDSGPQPHYRFTRQPVKYYRHNNQGARHPTPGRVARQPAAPARGSPGSADSSRSSSPEPGTQTLSQTLNVHFENTYKVENKVDVPPSPREVVQYMLGLDSIFTSVTTQESSQEEASGCQADQSTDLCDNRQLPQGRALCQSPKTLTVEHKMTSPAQKILSGLKLRRSHSEGKDEQLFV